MTTTTTDMMTGLSKREVAERVAKGQTNEIAQRTSRSLASIIRTNVFTLFNGILISAALIVLVVGHIQDVVFGGVMIINAIIGIVSEIRAKRTLDALAIVDAPTATVIRDGLADEIPTDGVVLDDVLRLTLGTQICVDGIILDSLGLEVDESLLTGESKPVKKKEGDQVLAGTSVVAGSALIRATRVGGDSYAQDIAHRARQFIRTTSQIQQSINSVLRVVSFLLVPVVIVTFWSQTRIVADGSDASWQSAIVVSVASVVGMIPQGLVLLTSMNFAIGSATLARRGVLIQELPAVEVLARVDCLCVDKTGTLTTGGIRVRTILVEDEADRGRILAALGALSEDRTNATAQAIWDHCEERAVAPEPTWTIPFSSARKWSACGTGTSAWILGAPEIVRQNSEESPLMSSVDEYASLGNRVVALAMASMDEDAQELPEERSLAALVVLEEDLRSDAAETLQYFRAQGVHVRVISGDNPVTVRALAAQVGLRAPDGGTPRVCDARTLPADTLSDEFQAMVEDSDVFGRVTPEQKRAMVEALQAKGHCVAMTGDGVNDALALKDADLGIAMGNGAQATKAVAQVVLVDSRFSVLPGVVAEGRRIIANMERVSALFLAKTTYAAILVIACAIMAWKYPFLPRHFTYIDVFTIGVPAFFLALAPNARRYVPGFLRRTLSLAVPSGAILAFSAILSYRLVGGESTIGSTAATLTLMIGAVWLLSITARPFKAWKLALLVTMVALAIAGIAFGVTRTFFALEWPSNGQWLIVVAIGATAGMLIEFSHRIYYARMHAKAQSVGESAD